MKISKNIKYFAIFAFILFILYIICICIYIYIYYILYGPIPSLNFPLRSSTAGRVGTFCWRPSFSHCIDSGELIRSQFPGENPFWIETESWGRKAPDGRAKLGRLTSALLGALSHVFHKLGTLASNGDVGANPADSYLVDPASSHMLVSKIKPCTCK